MPVSPSDLAVAQSGDTVWATDFTVWATEKTVAQTVEVPLGHEKRAPQRPLSSFALQRYNKTRRKANRRRRTQNGKIRKKGKWRRVVVPCPLTWHSVLVAAPAATPFLCRRNAAVPRVARQWVRPRSSAMSIDVALSTRRGVGRDTYSLPQKRGGAPGTMSMDMALLLAPATIPSLKPRRCV